MNFLKSIILLVLVGVFWSTSSVIKTSRLNQLMENGKIPYGPIPNKNENYYSYNSLESAFRSKLEIKRAEEFTKTEFEKLILDSLDPIPKQNLEKILTQTLDMSVDYQIDPFWIISVMMVESGFDIKAKSPKNAHGLMQIRPDTASHLYRLMGKKKINPIFSEQIHPSENIEVGIFYLKKLLHNFRMDYHLATIAYNIGPNKLRSLKNTNDIDTKNFSYLLKVQESYQALTKLFALELKKRNRPFELTYVVRNQGQIFEETLLKLYNINSWPLESTILLSSENLNHNSAYSLPF